MKEKVMKEEDGGFNTKALKGMQGLKNNFCISFNGAALLVPLEESRFTHSIISI